MPFITELIITLVVVVGISTAIGLPIARIQNRIIDDCFERRERHDKLLCGKLAIRDISDSELIALSHPLWTHIGMGGVGPRYNPSFTVFSLVLDELARRRTHEAP